MRAKTEERNAYIAGTGGSDGLVGRQSEALGESDELVAGSLELLDGIRNDFMRSPLCALL
jgi:hypothetical protein